MLKFNGNGIIFDNGSQYTAPLEYPIRAYIVGGMINLSNLSNSAYYTGLPIIYSVDTPNFSYVPLKLYGTIEYSGVSLEVNCESNINQALTDFPNTYVEYSSLEVILLDADDKIMGWATSATSSTPMPTHGNDGYKLTINVFDFPDLNSVPDTWVLTNTNNSTSQYEGRIFTDPVAYKQISSRFIDDRVISDTTVVSGSISIANIIGVTQAQYDAIATKDPNTLYVIT